MLNKKPIVAVLFAAATLPSFVLAEDAPKAPEPPKLPYSLTANVFLASDYYFRGITQTWGKPAIQGGADFVHDSGVYLGTWASNVSGNQYAGGSMEWDFYGGYNYKINDDFTVGAGLYYYYYPGANNDHAAAGGAGQSYDTLEGNISGSWKWVTAKLNYAFSDYFGASQSTGFTDSTDGTYYLQVDAAYPLAQVEGLSLVGHVGYTHYSNDLKSANANGKTDPSYADLKIGVSYVWKDGWTLGAYYIDTNNTDFYKHTASLANTDVKNLGGSGGYITAGRTF